MYFLYFILIIRKVGCKDTNNKVKMSIFANKFARTIMEKITFSRTKNSDETVTIDTTNMCSHLQKKLFEEDGIYHSLWMALQDDPELIAVVRSRQLHIYRKKIKAASKREQSDARIDSAEHEQARQKVKVLVLAGKSAPKIIREDSICELLQIERIKWMEHRFNHALAAIKDGSAESLKAIKEDVAELSKYYGSELWKQDFAADEAGKLPPDLKRGVLSEDGICNLLSDYREIQKTKQ